MIVRPGPARIRRNRAPGGLVFHVYDVETGLLVIAEAVTSPDDAEEHAELAAAVTRSQTHGDVCLVVYDGDSGRRWSAREIANAMGEP